MEVTKNGGMSKNIQDQADNSERQVRLNELQMEALGTQRKDYMTTSDFRENKHPVNLSDLEASRKLNQPGTEEYRAARKDAAALGGWAALHEKVKDDGTAEDGLQDFAGGQYHRAKLATEISSHPPGFFRGILGAPRGKPARKADIVVQKTRGGRLAAGRGGGVMGTRGRGGLTRPRGFFTPPPSPRTLEEFKVLVNSPPSIRKSPPSGPEPNVAPPGRRILNGKIIRPPSTPSVGSSDGHSKSNKTRVVRRQPRPNQYAGALATPADFLNKARSNILGNRTSPPTPKQASSLQQSIYASNSGSAKPITSRPASQKETAAVSQSKPQSFIPSTSTSLPQLTCASSLISPKPTPPHVAKAPHTPSKPADAPTSKAEVSKGVIQSSNASVPPPAKPAAPNEMQRIPAPPAQKSTALKASETFAEPQVEATLGIPEPTCHQPKIAPYRQTVSPVVSDVPAQQNVTKQSHADFQAKLNAASQKAKAAPKEDIKAAPRESSPTPTPRKFTKAGCENSMLDTQDAEPFNTRVLHDAEETSEMVKPVVTLPTVAPITPVEFQEAPVDTGSEKSDGIFGDEIDQAPFGHGTVTPPRTKSTVVRSSALDDLDGLQSDQLLVQYDLESAETATEREKRDAREYLKKAGELMKRTNPAVFDAVRHAIEQLEAKESYQPKIVLRKPTNAESRSIFTFNAGKSTSSEPVQGEPAYRITLPGSTPITDLKTRVASGGLDSESFAPDALKSTPINSSSFTVGIRGLSSKWVADIFGLPPIEGSLEESLQHLKNYVAPEPKPFDTNNKVAGEQLRSMRRSSNAEQLDPPMVKASESHRSNPSVGSIDTTIKDLSQLTMSESDEDVKGRPISKMTGRVRQLSSASRTPSPLVGAVARNNTPTANGSVNRPVHIRPQDEGAGVCAKELSAKLSVVKAGTKSPDNLGNVKESRTSQDGSVSQTNGDAKSHSRKDNFPAMQVKTANASEEDQKASAGLHSTTGSPLLEAASPSTLSKPLFGSNFSFEMKPNTARDRAATLTDFVNANDAESSLCADTPTKVKTNPILSRGLGASKWGALASTSQPSVTQKRIDHPTVEAHRECGDRKRIEETPETANVLSDRSRVRLEELDFIARNAAVKLADDTTTDGSNRKSSAEIFGERMAATKGTALIADEPIIKATNMKTSVWKDKSDFSKGTFASERNGPYGSIISPNRKAFDQKTYNTNITPKNFDTAFKGKAATETTFDQHALWKQRMMGLMEDHADKPHRQIADTRKSSLPLDIRAPVFEPVGKTVLVSPKKAPKVPAVASSMLSNGTAKSRYATSAAVNPGTADPAATSVANYGNMTRNSIPAVSYEAPPSDKADPEPTKRRSKSDAASKKLVSDQEQGPTNSTEIKGAKPTLGNSTSGTQVGKPLLSKGLGASKWSKGPVV